MATNQQGQPALTEALRRLDVLPEYMVTWNPIVLGGTTTVNAAILSGNVIPISLEVTLNQVNAGTAVNYWSWTLSGFGISSGTVDTKTIAATTDTAYSTRFFTSSPKLFANNKISLTFTQNNVGAGNLTVYAVLLYRKAVPTQ